VAAINKSVTDICLLLLFKSLFMSTATRATDLSKDSTSVLFKKSSQKSDCTKDAPVDISYSATDDMQYVYPFFTRAINAEFVLSVSLKRSIRGYQIINSNGF